MWLLTTNLIFKKAQITVIVLAPMYVATILPSQRIGKRQDLTKELMYETDFKIVMPNLFSQL